MSEELDKESKTSLVDWSNPPSLEDLKEDLEGTSSAHSGITAKINKYLDNLNITGSAKPAKIEGRSQVQPRVIRKQAEWRYSALSEPFLSTEDIFNVYPVTAEDVKAARQNQLILNNQFNTKMDKVAFIDEYVRTAVDEGTVIMHTGWEYEDEEYVEEQSVFEYVIDPTFAHDLQMIMEDIAENPSKRSSYSPEILTAIELSQEQQVPVRPMATGEVVEVTKTRVLKNQPTVTICDFRNTRIDPTCEGDLRKANFIIRSFETNLSELKKDGRYSNLDKINLSNTSVLNEPDHETKDNTFEFKDKARKRMVAYEYWGKRDIHGNGKTTAFVATWVGDTIIRLEESPFPNNELPFVSVPYLPVRKEIQGEPDGALLEDNQKVIGAVARGMIDVMARSANGQTGIRKDLLDATNRMRFRKGENYEFNSIADPRQGIYEHTYPELPASAQIMLQMQNAEAESLTGVIPFNSGMNGNALGDTATGVRSTLDAASKREMGILRRLSKGLIEVGRKFIAMNAIFLEEEEVVRITNDEFVPIRKDDLAGNFDLRMAISTAEEDAKKAEELSFMLQTVGPNTDPKMVFMLMADIARLRKMPDLARKLDTYDPQPDPIEQAKRELEVELIKEQINTERAKQQHLLGQAYKDQQQGDKAKTEADLNTLDFVEQESGVKQERDLQRIGEQARSQGQTKVMEALLNG